MAYYSNSSEGMILLDQCASCAFGEKSCPIFYVQLNYNYEQNNNKTATEILSHLVDDEKGCVMFTNFHKELSTDGKQLDLFGKE